jgi:hypothetical protein
MRSSLVGDKTLKAAIDLNAVSRPARREGTNAERMRSPLAGHYRSDRRSAPSEGRQYANAERMRNPLAGGKWVVDKQKDGYTDY